MTNLHKNVVAVLFLSIMMLVGIPTIILSGYSFVKSLSASQISKNSATEKHDAVHKIENSKNTSQADALTSENASTTFSFNFVKTTISDTESQFNKLLVCRLPFVYLHGFVQRILDKKTVNDVDSFFSIILDSHHRLHFAESKIETETVKKWADAIVDFHAFAKSQNTPLLYVQVPDKEPPNSNDFPIGIIKDTNNHLDDLLKQLEAQHVPCMDLRNDIQNDKLDWYSLHYLTDHHWTVETAFWANKKVIEKLNAEYRFNLDPQAIHRDIKNYDRFSLPFLGSQGKRVGPYYAGMNVYSYYLPRFETKMRVSKTLSDGTIESKTGNFYNTICDPTFAEGSALTGVIRYCIYFGGDFPLVRIDNPQGEKKILMIQDSHGLPFSAFLSLSTQELVIVDPRHYEGALREFISQEQYDLILILYGPSILWGKVTDRLYQ